MVASTNQNDEQSEPIGTNRNQSERKPKLERGKTVFRTPPF